MHYWTKESREKLSKTNKRLGKKPPSKLGVKMSQDTKDKIGRANAIANKGHKPPLKSKEGLERLRVFNTGRKMSVEAKLKNREAKLKNPVRYWLGKNRESMIGEKNWNWNNGSSNLGYSVNWKNSLKRSIRERDHYTCQIPGCNKQQDDIAHDVHHIDYDKSNCDPKNLITLCHHHHMKTNTKREYWKELFKIIINQIYAH
jgi:hypothetical protein